MFSVLIKVAFFGSLFTYAYLALCPRLSTEVIENVVAPPPGVTPPPPPNE